jgi:hypothetical protein
MLPRVAFVKNSRFGGIYRIHHQGEKIGKLGTTQAVIRN